jgi:hypothetical protein
VPVEPVPVEPAEPYDVGDVELGDETADVALLGSEAVLVALVPVVLVEP